MVSFFVIFHICVICLTIKISQGAKFVFNFLIKEYNHSIHLEKIWYHIFDSPWWRMWDFFYLIYLATYISCPLIYIINLISQLWHTPIFSKHFLLAFFKKMEGGSHLKIWHLEPTLNFFSGTSCQRKSTFRHNFVTFSPGFI